MTKTTITQRNRDVAEYLAQTSISDPPLQPSTPADGARTKSPEESARLAQELASQSSWADRYVPATPSETVMTPSEASVADSGERHTTSTDYATHEEAPPTYELATSSNTYPNTPPASEHSQSSRAPLPPSSQPQSRSLPPTLSKSQAGPPFVPGKHYERHETSTSITGTFTLHDSLDLSTTSGTISISLDVRPGSSPAILKLKAQSGSINVTDNQANTAQSRWPPRRGPSGFGRGGERRGPDSPGPLSFLFGLMRPPSQVAGPPMPTSDDPRKQPGQHLPAQPEAQDQPEDESTAFRVIHATIETQSGSINAHLLITPGSETRMSTNSGSISTRMVTTGAGPRALSKLEQEDSRLVAAVQSSQSSIFTTSTRSGSHSVQIQTGITDTSNGAIVSACRASHLSIGSGSVNCHYPREWTGLVHASSGGSGNVSVRGHGLEYDQRGNREVYAWRGVDLPDVEKAVEVRCDNSGSVGFYC